MSANGPLVHLLHPGYDNDHLIKTAAASPPQLAQIQRFLKGMNRSKGSLYVLVSALGAGEYWGSNSNGDYFGEEPLLHVPQGWMHMPHEQQKLVGKRWEWGYPTFYNAHAFQHHVNKDPARAFGTVEYVSWDPNMKRVLLVIDINRDRARQMGAHGVVDRIENGEFPDVSMGCFSTGMLVSMADGTKKPIEDVCVGEEVITHKGRARKVTEVHKRKYKGELYSIKAEAHRTLRCTHRHPLLSVLESNVKAKDSHSNLVWRKDPLLVPEWRHAECLFDEYLIEPVLRGKEDREVDSSKRGTLVSLARMIGYYSADGHVLRDDNGRLRGIELTVNKNNPVISEIDALCEELSTRNKPIVRPKANSDEALKVSIHDDRLAEKMFQFAGAYSKHKRLSREVMAWPPLLISEMLGAYTNGDGCSYNGSIRLSTASEDLAHQLVSLLPRLGILCSYSSVTHKAGSGFNKTDTVEWGVHVGKQWASILAPYSAKVKVAEVLKKKNSRMIYGNSIVTPIRSIESMYVETDVYNLEVEEDESYLVEGLAVHNCKVPYDICSICADWERITKNPRVDLAEHRRHPIRGFSTVTNEYCQHLQNELNKIYPDGRKVKMLNIHPRFFDLSLVFIGADKTSKVLAKLAHKQCPIRVNSPMCKQGCTKCSPAHAIPSSHVHDVWDREKVASGPYTYSSKLEERDDQVLRSNSDRRILQNLSKRDVTPGFLVDVSQSPNQKIRQAVLNHPNVPKVTADRLRKTSADHILKEAFGDPGLDDHIPEAEQDAVSSYFRKKYASPIVKRSEITKRVRSHFNRTLPALESSEPDLPDDIQDKMSDRLSDSLSTCGGLGIVAKPREFQRMYIRAIGKPDLAEELDANKLMFRTGAPPSRDFGLSGKIIPSLIRSLLPMIGSRSAFGPPLHKRTVVVIKIRPKPVEDDHDCMDHPFLDKISGAYSAYRRDLMYKTASLISTAIHENPQIAGAVFGGALDRNLVGGIAKEGGDVLQSVIGMLPATYLNRAYMTGPVSGYVEEHSDLNGLITAGELASIGGAA